MPVVPDFRQIYSYSRTPSEEKELKNAAVFKFLGFIGIVISLVVISHIAEEPPSSL